ncbi:PEF-CTERM sorting domain-containing protein [Methanosarcina mazei]|uniref:PEF-CTERM sorting domain-containing protein n=1 Tax=Methanosarcina mazei TaxID=2209 RepID=UPI0009BBD71C|nr:PEF-CTERM sorting domain-containing protein [Methanosarcina mazei]
MPHPLGWGGRPQFDLTNTSENVTGIKIAVTFNGTHIIVTDASPALVGVDKVNILAIGLYLDDQYVDNVTDYAEGSTWTHGSINHDISEFGDFNTLCSRSNQKIKTSGPIVIALNPSFTQSKLPANVVGNSIVVHLAFGTELLDVSGKKQSSSWVGGGTEIPEFSTIAVPMAAILGLMFIFGRKKQE